jgi:hypothetical protein
MVFRILHPTLASAREMWGGGFSEPPDPYYRRLVDRPTSEDDDVGFRVAMIPEPTTALLVACGLVGLVMRRRRVA